MVTNISLRNNCHNLSLYRTIYQIYRGAIVDRVQFSDGMICHVGQDVKEYQTASFVGDGEAVEGDSVGAAAGTGSGSLLSVSVKSFCSEQSPLQHPQQSI